MHVLLSVHQFFPEFATGGTEVLAYQTARALMQCGHRVTVLSGHSGPVDLPHEQRFVWDDYDGIRILRYLHAHFTSPLQTNVVESEYKSAHFLALFRPLLANLAPSVVHFFHFSRLSATAIDAVDELGLPMVFTPTDFWPLCVNSQLRLPNNDLCEGPTATADNCLRHYVQMTQSPETQAQFNALSPRKVEVLIRGDHRHKFTKQWFGGFVRAVTDRPAYLRNQMNRMERILAPTQLMYQMLQRHGVETKRLYHSPYGVSVENIPRQTDRGRGAALKVGFIGQLVEHKAPHLLIEAVKGLPAEVTIEAEIYGDLKQDVGYGARLMSLAASEPRVHFRGTFPNAQIGAVFAGLDVLVVPSIWYENTPLVIYNALAAGCPLVVTNLGGMAEPVPENVAGLHFPRGDVPALRRQLLKLYQDRDFLRRLSAGTKIPKTIPEYVDELHGHYAFARYMRKGSA